MGGNSPCARTLCPHLVASNAYQPGFGDITSAAPTNQRGTEMNNNLKQTDDQYLAVTEVMETISTAMEGKGTETLLVINLGSEGDDAVLGGNVTAASIQRLEQLLGELKARHDADMNGVLHVWCE